MFSDIKRLVSPDMMQKVTLSLYQWIKLSLYMSLYSIPWVLVNTFFRLTKETLLLFVLSFLLAIPNIVVALSFSKESTSFRKYTHYLKNTYVDSLKNGLFITGILLFLSLDSYIVLFLMNVNYFFPLIYITFLFVIVWSVYFLYFQQKKETLFMGNLKTAMFFSWRCVLLSVGLFLLIMLWLSIGYFLQGMNIIVGTGLVWGVIARLIEKRVGKTINN
ncbi:hypothetical protein ACFC89_15640 [Enterococcus casseliflavus]|uniref:hypothetical protein n=1 Tax=Enterococcus casseliflavus TaxID=37734 RepID=UPI0039A72F28